MPDVLTKKLEEKGYTKPRLFNIAGDPTMRMMPFSLPKEEDALTRRLTERVDPVTDRIKTIATGIGGGLKKGLWWGLGVITWPLQRIEYALATPTTTLVKTITPLVREPIKDVIRDTILDTPKGREAFKDKVRAKLTPYAIEKLGDDFEENLDKAAREVFKPKPPEYYQQILTEEVKPALKELPTAFGRGAKALAPVPLKWTRTDPETLKIFNDFWGAYYEGMTDGEKAPEWYKQIAGIGTSFLLVPLAFSKLLKLGSQAGRALPFVKKIEAARIPAWEAMKLRTKVRIGTRTETATELGKSLAGKDIKRLAKELSAKTGTKITPQAVKLRLGQLVRGGITEQETLRTVANPVIAEFTKTAKELRKLGLLPEETFLTKLPKKRIAELLKQKDVLRSQIAKLQKAPYKDTLLKKASKLKISGREKIASDLWDLASKVNRNEAKYVERLGEILNIKTTQPGTLRKLVSRFADAGAKEREQIITKLWQLGEKTVGQEIKGLRPLIKRISTMKRQFPGQAEKIAQLQEKIGAITDKIQTSYELGGTEYLARLYRTKEDARLARKFPLFAPKRIRQQYAKQRGKIPFEVRRAMGEIKEPAYPVVKRLIQEGSDIETSRLFNYAAKHKKWVGDVWRKGLAKEQLPDTKAYGALRNKFVAPKIYNDVKELMRVRGDFESFYDAIIGTWKAGKVLWNPATHFRNMLSNSILLDLSGVDHIQQAKLLKQLANEIKTNSKEWQNIQRYFARTTLAKGELLDDLLKGVKAKGDGLRKTLNAIPHLSGKGAAKVYHREELIAKGVKYLEQRNKGKSVLKAVQEGNKWLFDYGELAAWEKRIARRIMPFYTFPRKALPRIAEAAANNPYALAKYPMLAKMTTQYSLYQLDLTAKDYEQIKKVLPEYMQRGSYVLMPWRDKNGDLRFFDWTYVVPWGELYEAQERGILKAGVTNPVAQMWADISRNKSGWTEREIYKETDTLEEKTYKSMEYIWQGLVPSLSYKGIYWDKLYEAGTGKPDKRRKIRPLPETVAHTIFGLRTQAVDVDEAKKFKIYETQRKVRELESKMRDVIMRFGAGNITEEEYNKKRDQYIKQAQDTVKGLSEILGGE